MKMNTIDERFAVIDTVLMAASVVWFISVIITAMA
jgi:hypothetical protein